MAVEAVKIPQNVYIEDRIIGPLTLRQIMLMAVGGGFSYALYSTLLKTYGQLNLVVTVLVWAPLAVTAAFALIKINDLSLLRICMLMLETMNKPATRTFAPRRGIEINIRLASSKAPAKAAAKADPADAIHEKKIRELSSIVDQGMQIPATDDVNIEQTSRAETITTNEQQGPPPTMEELANTPIDDAPSSTFPVNPSRIAVDGKKLNQAKEKSDLSVFRDVFPSSSAT